METSASLSNQVFQSHSAENLRPTNSHLERFFTARSRNAAEVLSGPQDGHLVWPLSVRDDEAEGLPKSCSI